MGSVSQHLWRFLQAPWHRYSASQANAIVVLSSSRHLVPGPARLSEWNDPDRFPAGLDLYRAGKAPLLLFTGGVRPFRPDQHPEGELYLREAAFFGVPQSALASTLPVLNTYEEAVAIRNLLPVTQLRVLLVTSAFYMHRAHRFFARQGFEVYPYPVDFQARSRFVGRL